MGKNEGEERARKATGQHLEYLLLARDECREVWISEARRWALTIEKGKVNQTAVARVMAKYLHSIDKGPDPDSPEMFGKRLCKDMVSRAFSGQILPSKTLEIFILVFAISEADAKHLRWLHHGGDGLEAAAD